MPLAKQRSTTLEEYEALPADTRAEVFDGQIQYMAGPSRTHQAILLELSSLLSSYVKKKGSWMKNDVMVLLTLSLKLFPPEIRQMIIYGKRTTTRITKSANIGL